jgi:hypothetical protein
MRKPAARLGIGVAPGLAAARRGSAGRRARLVPGGSRGRAARLGLPALALAAVVAALALPGAVQAQPTGQAISDPSTQSLEPRLAVAPDGTAIAAWISMPAGGNVVEVSTRPPGGAWSTPATVSIPAEVNPFAPSVAIDGDHDAVIAWEATPHAGSGATYNTEIQAVVSEAGGAFGPPQVLSPATPIGSEGSAAGSPSAAIDEAGEATVAWWPYNDAHPTVDTASHPAGGPWQPMVGVEPSPAAPMNAQPDPQLVADAAGDLAVIWRNPLDETFYDGPGTARLAFRPAGSTTWEAPVDLSHPGDTIGARMSVGIDSLGQATAVWDDETTGYLEASTVAPGGLVPTPVRVSEASTHPLESPAITVDPSGDMTAVWIDVENFSTSEVIRSSTSLAGGLWSTPTAISPVDHHVGAVSLAGADDGQAAVEWEEKPEQPPYFATIRLISQGSDGAWGASQILAEPLVKPGGPAIALSPGGDLSALWYAFDGSTGKNVIEALSEDHTPPALSVDVPASATVGRQVQMTATATDTSEPVTVGWSFGDGATATGPSVAHAYAAAGDETVTITATDAAGNTTTLTRTIAVVEPVEVGGGTNPGTNPTTAPAGSPGTQGPASRPGDSGSPGQPTAAQVIGLEEAGGCRSMRTMSIRLHRPKGYTVRSVRVAVTHKKTVTYRGRRARVKINLVGLPLGRYTVTVTVKLSPARKLTLVRRYLTCTPGHHKKKHRKKTHRKPSRGDDGEQTGIDGERVGSGLGGGRCRRSCALVLVVGPWSGDDSPHESDPNAWADRPTPRKEVDEKQTEKGPQPRPCPVRRAGAVAPRRGAGPRRRRQDRSPQGHGPVAEDRRALG